MKTKTIDADQILIDLERVKFWAKKYRQSNQENRQEVWEKVKAACDKIPDDIMETIKLLSDLDIESVEHVRPDFDPMKMSIWEKMVKNNKWRGYWMNATGLDVELYINSLIGALKYPDDRKNRTIEKWFRDNNPNVRPVPYSITAADKDFNNYFHR